MATKSNYFSPSINIERDANRNFEYILTPNSIEIYNQIVSKFKSGTKSFSIIGSYGTGKSSFIVALKRTLKGEQEIFPSFNGELNDYDGFEFDLFTGQYSSLISDVKERFNLDSEATEKDILVKLKEIQSRLKAEGKSWFIILDEFGKYLEFASKNYPEKELYFVQLLAEFANDDNNDVFFINTLHQSFDSYALGLDLQQRKEWDKVKGRFKELAFNEPVEQLLHIAVEHLGSNESTLEQERANTIVSLIDESHVFPFNTELNADLVRKLNPLEPVSASIVALSLQTYGQNERSLFSFLNSDDERGLLEFDSLSGSMYGVAQVFDYLIYNHHSVLISKYNPHFVQWNSIRSALERTEKEFKQHTHQYISIVKTIGLLNIFSSSAAEIDRKFLTQYFNVVSAIKNADELINNLEKQQIIRFREFKKQFILYDGTDLNIEHELGKAHQKVEKVLDVVPYIKQHYSLPYIPAKRVYFEKGTPRFFKFEISDKLFESEIEHPIDGIINLVFGQSHEEVASVSESVSKPILYGVYTKVGEIRDLIHDIHKVEFVLNVIDNDKVAERELKALREDQVESLNTMILDNIFTSSSDIKWIYNGDLIELNSQKKFNNFLSYIIEDVYSSTPIYKNELVNKHKVSPAIYKPRKDLLRKLMDNRHDEDLGFAEHLFPPEKSIYLSLLKNTGIHRVENGVWDFYPPNDDSGLILLWEACESFFEDSKLGAKELMELYHLLQKPPYGLKAGLIDLWIPIYVIIKSNECALYYEDAYVPEINYDVINLVFRNPKLFKLKAFNLSEEKKELFNKYRLFQNLPKENSFSNKSFVETIRPFLLSYNKLNEYGRKTNTISHKARLLRDTLKTATDPEEAFFYSFPRAIGYSDLESLKSEKTISAFVQELHATLEEIEHSFSKLVDRIESHLLSTLNIDLNTPFEDYKKRISKRYSSIKTFRLADYQKKLLNRLMSKLNDREKWVNSIGLALIDRPLEKLRDSEEEKLFFNLATRIKELESLLELNEVNFDTKNDIAYKFSIMPIGKKAKEEIISISKDKLVEQDDLINDLKSKLTGDRNNDLAVLLKLIDEISNNGN
jgi:hypothetical protein